MTRKRKFPKRVRYVVQYDRRRPDGWNIFRDGVCRGEFWTRAAAHSIACHRAREEWRLYGQPTEVLLKKRDGKFSKWGERTYGNDPRKSRG